MLILYNAIADIARCRIENFLFFLRFLRVFRVQKSIYLKKNATAFTYTRLGKSVNIIQNYY